MANENNNTDSRCRTCKHKRNCINGMFCTVLNVYVEYARMDGCEHYGLDNDVKPKGR